jgi:hypothetical protein
MGEQGAREGKTASFLSRSRLAAAGVAAGVAVGLGAGYLLFGNADEPLESSDAGIPPPEYAYLDDARVVSYLGQIEGGLTGTERRTSSLRVQGSAGVDVAGANVGGAREEEQFVERVVTPTATARFYRLLERLTAKGYLDEFDAARPAEFLRKLRRTAEGRFVRIRNCRVELPNHIVLYKVLRAPRASTPLRQSRAFRQTGVELTSEQAARDFMRVLGPDASVPFGSCNGKAGKPDLLFVARYSVLNREHSVFSGRVTVVGKLTRRVDAGEPDYLNSDVESEASNAAWALALRENGRAGDPTPIVLTIARDLVPATRVTGPGAVIIPIAIYK